MRRSKVVAALATCLVLICCAIALATADLPIRPAAGLTLDARVAAKSTGAAKSAAAKGAGKAGASGDTRAAEPAESGTAAAGVSIKSSGIDASASDKSSAAAASAKTDTPTKAKSSTKKRKLKTITVGYENYPPLCYLDEDGNPAGIDMDIATEAFRRMGYRPVFKPIKWTQKDELLQKGDIDCIWCCFSMEGREDLYTWAGPYLKSEESVAVMPDSPIKSLRDLADKTVGVAATAEPERVLLDDLNPHVGTVKHVYSLQDTSYLYPSLSKGYVDAIAAHRLAIEQYMKDYGVKFRILDEPLIQVKAGVAFLRGTKSRVPGELGETLAVMRRDGTIRKIIARYVDDPQNYVLGDADE